MVSNASEFDTLLPVRHHEDSVLRQLSTRLPQKLAAKASFTSPHVKANLLLQAHLSRISLAAELKADTDKLLLCTVRLIQVRSSTFLLYALHVSRPLLTHLLLLLSCAANSLWED